MYTVTIHVGDAAEMRRLADALESFCAVQARDVKADAVQLELPGTTPPAEQYEDKAQVRKRRGRKPAAQPDAPAPAPAADPTEPVTDEALVAAVRVAMRGAGGVPAVRKALDDLGLKTALDADEQQRVALMQVLTVLGTGTDA